MSRSIRILAAVVLACATTAAHADARGALKQLQASTFELRIVRPAEGVVAIAPALVVDKSGLAIAPARPLIGAQSVTASVPGAPRPVGVLPMSVDPFTGLALVKLDLSHPMVAAQVKPAELADAAPGERESVWLGAVHAGKHDVKMADFDEAAPFDELDRGLRAALNHGSVTNWLEVKGVIGPEHAGVAAFNDAGRVVGLSVYTWQRRARSGAVLSYEHLADLIDTKPAQPMTWFQYDQAVGDAELPTVAWPRVDVTQGRSADDLRRSLGAFRGSYECLRCRGAAVVTERVKVGTVRRGSFDHPVYENKEIPCPRCEGTGLNNAEALGRSLRIITANTAMADRTDPKLKGAFGELRAMMAEVGEKHTIALQNLLMTEAKATMAGGPKKIGEPILVLGELSRQVEATGFARPLIGIGVGDRRAGRERFVIDDARLIGQAEAKVAIVGGVLAGYVGVGEGKLLPVVSHGFVVPLVNPQEPER